MSLAERALAERPVPRAPCWLLTLEPPGTVCHAVPEEQIGKERQTGQVHVEGWSGQLPVRSSPGRMRPFVPPPIPFLLGGAGAAVPGPWQ